MEVDYFQVRRIWIGINDLIPRKTLAARHHAEHQGSVVLAAQRVTLDSKPCTITGCCSILRETIVVKVFLCFLPHTFVLVLPAGHR